jgi:hypothetical protein
VGKLEERLSNLRETLTGEYQGVTLPHLSFSVVKKRITKSPSISSGRFYPVNTIVTIVSFLKLFGHSFPVLSRNFSIRKLIPFSY